MPGPVDLKQPVHQAQRVSLIDHLGTGVLASDLSYASRRTSAGTPSREPPQ